MADDVEVEVARAADHDVLRLSGPLSMVSAPAAREAILKRLADRGRVAVDVSGLVLEWEPALGLFPAALSAAGGWPSARLVLCHAPAPLAAALRRARVPDTVPLAPDLAAAASRLDTRPRRVSRHRDLPCHPAAAQAARATLTEVCADWEIVDATESAVLVGNELVTNAVEHARTSCRLSVSLDDRGLHLGVRDYGPPAPVRTAPIDLGAPRGRGLHVVALLCPSWGVLDHPDGKTIWATLAATPR